jgi:hypothetical protein
MSSDSQLGGKLLGQGVYGCAFSPPLKCVVRKAKATPGRKVGKIETTEEAQKEFTVSKKLEKIPHAETYFTLLESLCTPAPRSQQTEKDLSKCDAIKSPMLKRNLLPGMSQVTMPFAGVPLALTPHRVANIDFFAMSRHLLEAGTLLLTARIIHADIHMMNVMVNSRTSTTFIDFGQAWSVDELSLANISSRFHQFNPRIGQNPPECCVIDGLTEVNPPSLQTILYRMRDQNPLFQLIQQLFQIPVETQLATIKRFVETSWSFQEENWFSFYKLYWSKFDAWAIGVNIIVLYVGLLSDPVFERSEEFRRNGNMPLRVIKGLLTLDPGLRMDCAEALAIWAPESPILQLPAVKKWLQEQARIREQLAKIL